ncbi:MAG: hypothetical protein UT41_C0004G0009 [Candidatus Wolfebacteria bacterium GW2011_GWC2_39_22]|uniref:Glycosyltransferase RgtA/B/C/D-like domain-containing protein n=1 Tax=Candidatus Wolfebacteria bacterium GW2011_GWC2_39_22 TaxID=1619013 RepID=A0A0G0REF6_9BACT|nr:MAG: hypothetical protein UT41_C0004G0009 [Candidatus Wolfebacteria bacterium GW2011_GWC2_39_22]
MKLIKEIKVIKVILNDYKFHFFWAALILLAASKLILVANNEILALYAPHDELWHISAASRAFWFAKEYTQMTFIQYPVYPLFIFITHFFGIPLRVIIEIFYILSAFLLSLSLIKAGLNRFLGIICFALIIFQPITFYLFDHTLAETLYAPLLLLSVASFIQLWINREENRSLLFSFSTGVFFALLWLTRKESALIAMFLFFVALAILATSFKNKHFLKNTFTVLKRTTIIPLAIIFLFYIIICSANYQTFGLFAPSELDASGYKSAYNALQRIQTSKSTQYVPVSSEAREIAYSVSPSFQKVRPFLEDKNNFAFFWTKKSQGIDNEMAAGWFYWMLRDATYAAGFKDATSADTFYKQVASEINSAIKENKIKSRFVLIDFIDPDFYKYLPQFPTSFTRISQLIFTTEQPPAVSDNPDLTSNVKDLFDEMANRRTIATKSNNDQTSLKGWAFQDDERLISVGLTNALGELLTSNSDFASRQDVQEFYAKDGVITPLNSGFDISYTGDKTLIRNGLLEFVTDKNTFKIPIDSLKKNKLTKIETNGSTLMLSIENKSFPKLNLFEKITIKIKQCIWSIYGEITKLLSFTALLALVFSTIKMRKLKIDNITMIIVFLSFIIITRILLFSLLDTASWDGAQPRYIFPIMPLYAAVLLLVINKILPKRNF